MDLEFTKICNYYLSHPQPWASQRNLSPKYKNKIIEFKMNVDNIKFKINLYRHLTIHFMHARNNKSISNNILADMAFKIDNLELEIKNKHYQIQSIQQQIKIITNGQKAL
jgi:hypothetical protein